MPTLLVYPRYTPSTRALLRAARALGWEGQRVEGDLPQDFAIPDELAVFATPPLAYQLAASAGRRLLSCPVGWEASLPERYSRRSLRCAPFEEIGPPEERPFFLKPALSKSFEPSVYEFDQLSGLQIPPRAQVLLAEPVHFDCELRFFVLHGRVAASAFTRVHHRDLTKRTSVPASAHREASEFVARLLADPILEFPPAFVLDVGLIAERGWAVVEANEAWASGLYGCDPADVLPVLLACCVPLDSDQARWDQAAAFLEARGEPFTRSGPNDQGLAS